MTFSWNRVTGGKSDQEAKPIKITPHATKLRFRPFKMKKHILFLDIWNPYDLNFNSMQRKYKKSNYFVEIINFKNG